ncbi:hypothetical protein D3C71_25150 [compost metagenome]
MATPLEWAGQVQGPGPVSDSPEPGAHRPRASLEDVAASLGTAVWRGDELASAPLRTTPTGFAELDRELPGAGWPSHALTELLQAQPATAEWRLLAPAMKQVMAEGGQVVMVGPPRQPHLPGLRAEGLDEKLLVWIRAETASERLWCTEQLVKSGACGLVVSWLAQARPEQIRRLHVCAQACEGPVFVCRPLAALREPSAAPLRLSVHVEADWQLRVELLKRRGGALERPLVLPSVPAGLEPLITPRIRRPSDILQRRRQGRPVKVPSRSTDVVGSSSPQSGALRIASE